MRRILFFTFSCSLILSASGFASDTGQLRDEQLLKLARARLIHTYQIDPAQLSKGENASVQQYLTAHPEAISCGAYCDSVQSFCSDGPWGCNTCVDNSCQ